MLLWLLQQTTLGLLLLILGVALFLVTKYYKIMGRIKHYVKQGVHAPQGWDTFILGHVKQMIAY